MPAAQNSTGEKKKRKHSQHYLEEEGKGKRTGDGGLEYQGEEVKQPQVRPS